MSEQPEERNRDSRNSAMDNIEQPRPVEKQDPTEPITVGSGKGSASGREGKASGGATGT